MPPDAPVACYLAWGEVILTSGIFRNLIIPQLLAMAQSGRWKVIVVCGVPIINVTFLFHRRRWVRQTETVRRMLKEGGIDLRLRPLFVPSFWFSTPALLIPLFHFRHIHFLSRTIRKERVTVVNCRSYHAALLANLSRARLKWNAGVVFDTRGAFPEECVMRHSYARASLSYAVWKRIEAWLLKTSDAVVNVSEEFSAYVEEISPSAKCLTIHACTDLRAFDQEREAERVRSRLGIPAAAMVLAYLGNIAPSGYHSLELVACILEVLAAAQPAETRLLIISQSPRGPILSGLERAGVESQRVHLHSAGSIGEAAAMLMCADYGAFPFVPKISRDIRVMARTMIGSKVPEYLAAGLPIIANSLATGVAKLVTSHAVGVTFDPGCLPLLGEAVSAMDRTHDSYRERCRGLARDLFDIRLGAARYLDAFDKVAASSRDLI